MWFESFFEHDGSWIASNVRGRPLQADDFLDWYGGADLTDDGMAAPRGHGLMPRELALVGDSG